MLQGVTIVDPDRFDARGTVQVGRDVYIDVNVVLEGTVRIGDRVRIGPNVVVRNCDIGDDVEILPNCVFDGAKIGARAIVGPFARLRPEAGARRRSARRQLRRGQEVGAQGGAKANHLTYLGDATVGARVNVGAGTITCNYDGANKWHTEIGDGAFIGSGTMLVAPVTVGAEATIGAGSTITRDAPDGKLTLERSKQTTVDGWQRPVKSNPRADDATGLAHRARRHGASRDACRGLLLHVVEPTEDPLRLSVVRRAGRCSTRIHDVDERPASRWRMRAGRAAVPAASGPADGLAPLPLNVLLTPRCRHRFARSAPFSSPIEGP